MNIYLRKECEGTDEDEEYIGSSEYHTEEELVTTIFHIAELKMPFSDRQYLSARRLGIILDSFLVRNRLFLMDDIDPEADIVLVAREDFNSITMEYVYEYRVEIRDASYNGSVRW